MGVKVVRHGLVVVVGLSVVHVMVWRGPVRCVGWVAHGSDVVGSVVMGVAFALGHWEVGSGAVGAC